MPNGLAALWFILKYRFSLKYAEPGQTTLDALEQAPRLNQWMFDTIKPWLGMRIAELGSGTGNLTDWLRRVPSAQVLATDCCAAHLQSLQLRFGQTRSISIRKLDLVTEEEYALLEDFQPDTIVCLNVLEHIEMDLEVLRRLRRSLPGNCRIVFLVPRGRKLWSRLDARIGHYRRYEPGDLAAKMRVAGFMVEHEFTFNRAGTLAWFIANKLGRQSTIRPWQARTYNLLCPLFQGLERVLPWQGLSIVCVGAMPGRSRKRSEPILALQDMGQSSFNTISPVK